jgi:hypothetical protein
MPDVSENSWAQKGHGKVTSSLPLHLPKKKN